MPAPPNFGVDDGRLREGQIVERALLVGFEQRPNAGDIDRAVEFPVVILGPVIGLMENVDASFGTGDGQVGQPPGHIGIAEVPASSRSRNVVECAAMVHLKLALELEAGQQVSDEWRARGGDG